MCSSLSLRWSRNMRCQQKSLCPAQPRLHPPRTRPPHHSHRPILPPPRRCRCRSCAPRILPMVLCMRPRRRQSRCRLWSRACVSFPLSAGSGLHGEGCGSSVLIWRSLRRIQWAPFLLSMSFPPLVLDLRFVTAGHLHRYVREPATFRRLVSRCRMCCTELSKRKQMSMSWRSLAAGWLRCTGKSEARVRHLIRRTISTHRAD